MGSQGGRTIISPDSYTCTSSLGARGFGTTTWKTYLKKTSLVNAEDLEGMGDAHSSNQESVMT